MRCARPIWVGPASMTTVGPGGAAAVRRARATAGARRSCSPATAQTRDPSLREQLVESYLPLARSIARRYQSPRVPTDDLVQVAAIGLMKAVDRYDPARGVAFSSYAVPTMVGEVQRHFRDHTWGVRPPRDLQERAQRVLAINAHAGRRARPPADRGRDRRAPPSLARGRRRGAAGVRRARRDVARPAARRRRGDRHARRHARRRGRRVRPGRGRDHRRSADDATSTSASARSSASASTRT